MYAVISTAHRGVFFGEIEEADRDRFAAAGDHEPGANRLTIKNARMCVYWDRETKGYNGLAADGPTAGCRITPAVRSMTVNSVTSIMEASDEAVKAWEAEPWG